MTGPKDERVQIVADSEWVEKVDKWRNAQPGPLNRSQAIRQLTIAGLAYYKLRDNTK